MIHLIFILLISSVFSDNSNANADQYCFYNDNKILNALANYRLSFLKDKIDDLYKNNYNNSKNCFMIDNIKYRVKEMEYFLQDDLNYFKLNRMKKNYLL